LKAPNKINVLVTGGAGYLGSVLVDKLLNMTCIGKVYVLDNLMYKQQSFLHHFKHFHTNKFEFIYGDVRNSLLLQKYVNKADVIIPLAAIVGFPACETDKSLATEVNFEQVNGICKMVSDEQLIIYPNTNSGYGVNESQEFCTEETELNPISHYGMTKCNAEEEVLSSRNGVSLRLATVFGCSPRMRLDLLVNDFVYKACTENYIILFEHKFRRNFIHVSDVAEAFKHFILDYYLYGAQFNGEAFNVGLSSANLNKLQLCEKIKEFIPDFVINTSDFSSDPDKRDYIVSNKKLENLGWLPAYSIDDGISELMSLYSGLKNINTNFTNL
jgi:nucleoside-diphosphate-sugar epimerase